jgi:DNA repair photolyase
MDGKHTPRGRGAAQNPASRFDRLRIEPDPEWLDAETGAERAERRIPTEYFRDDSRAVVSRNHSPDIPFDWSVNPYRGCEHGCAYCYARPTHEFLGLSAGLDFESRILVKAGAPALLARRLAARDWVPQVVALSGVTDGYQPAERRLRITRGCLEVFLKYGNPVEIVTKSALILRDLDVLGALAARRLVRVTLSVTTLDGALARRLEPRAAAPGLRLEAIGRLAEAGVPVGVNVAPVIPGLTDHELPAILKAAAGHGATAASYLLLRLPHGVKELFLDWLAAHYPERASKVERAIRAMRGGKLNEGRFGLRMRGDGPRADVIERLFALHCGRLGLNRKRAELNLTDFRRPGGPQQELFGAAP